MSNFEMSSEEILLAKFEKLALKIEQLTDEISKMKTKLDKNYKVNRTFGLKTIRNSEPLNFARDVMGIGSPTKRYLLSLRAITEEWKGRKNDVLITIRQQEKETHMDLKALGIRIPISDIKNISILAKQILSLLYISCELRGIEINEILREIITEINNEGHKMIQEIKQKLIL
ncbi:MAG: hypothetical protein JSV23_09705 [Promethearchaeota archaeon]|nr:MAG: hypothetical protein JSV23_09705 [Candidatus Lokiarchaeota archaeon]